MLGVQTLLDGIYNYICRGARNKEQEVKRSERDESPGESVGETW